MCVAGGGAGVQVTSTFSPHNDKGRYESIKVHCEEPLSLLGLLTEHGWGVDQECGALKAATLEGLYPAWMTTPYA